jgi:hypothetical protein
MLKAGTTTGHYIKFISETFHMIDKREDMTGFYLIMDNALIYTSKEIQAIIKERNRDYKCVYLPSPQYSPKFDSVEEIQGIDQRESQAS